MAMSTRLASRSLMTNWRPSIFPGIPFTANGTTPSSLKNHNHLICGSPLSVFPFWPALFQEGAQALVGISGLHHPREVEDIDLVERFQAVLVLFLSHAYTGLYKVQGDG